MMGNALATLSNVERFIISYLRKTYFDSNGKTVQNTTYI